MTASPTESLHIDVNAQTRVSALLQVPQDAVALYIFAHGAGAGMRHAFMNDFAAALALRGMGTLRYQFPYMETGSHRPDPPALCHATVRAAVAEARRRAPGVLLIAGGKSFGGRMTSQAQAAAALPDVAGLAFVGFPLHPAKRPSDERGAHLAAVQVPMLFLQGTRDALADMSLLEPLAGKLGPRATLKRIEGADHSFHVPARSGRTDGDVRDELADALVSWTRALKVSAAR
jgi:predicted alpha/beta-hydrolase family hydrolase